MKTTKESPNGTDRKTAAVVRVLFILGTVPALLVLPLYGNTVNAPDHLTASAADEGQMIILTAMKFLMGVACAGIGLALYPILKKYLVGITLTLISALSVMFQLVPPFGTIQILLNLPILPQEMVLAVWLIAKGIRPTAVASLPAKTATNKLLGAA